MQVDGTGTQEEIFERVRPIFTSLRYILHSLQAMLPSMYLHQDHDRCLLPLYGPHFYYCIGIFILSFDSSERMYSFLQLCFLPN